MGGVWSEAEIANHAVSEEPKAEMDANQENTNSIIYFLCNLGINNKKSTSNIIIYEY